MSIRSEKEMAKRSRLAEIVRKRDLIRGSLTIRKRVCGKANCWCTSGGGHSSMYLSYSHNGKLQQMYIPEEYQQMVSEWVGQYKDARGLLEAISSLSLKKLPRIRKQQHSK